VAKSPSEQIRDLNLEVRATTERASALRDHITDMKARDEKRQDELIEIRRELATLRQENAVLRQQLQDHVAQYQEWDRRRWGLIVMLIGAVLSLASGLIVTLARK
jgi:predicted  nucleic acid-binding Zn-ribbon protein